MTAFWSSVFAVGHAESSRWDLRRPPPAAKDPIFWAVQDPLVVIVIATTPTMATTSEIQIKIPYLNGSNYDWRTLVSYRWDFIGKRQRFGMTEFSTGNGQEAATIRKSWRKRTRANKVKQFQLSPALRNRLTEVWCPISRDKKYMIDIIEHNLQRGLVLTNNQQQLSIASSMVEFILWFSSSRFAGKSKKKSLTSFNRLDRRWVCDQTWHLS